MDIVRRASIDNGKVVLSMTLDEYEYLKRSVEKGEKTLKTYKKWYEKKKQEEEELGVVKRPRGRPRKVSPPKLTPPVVKAPQIVTPNIAPRKTSPSLKVVVEDKVMDQ